MLPVFGFLPLYGFVLCFLGWMALIHSLAIERHASCDRAQRAVDIHATHFSWELTGN